MMTKLANFSSKLSTWSTNEHATYSGKYLVFSAVISIDLKTSAFSSLHVLEFSIMS